MNTTPSKEKTTLSSGRYQNLPDRTESETVSVEIVQQGGLEELTEQEGSDLLLGRERYLLGLKI